MNKLEQLAQEAADLGHPNMPSGNVFVSNAGNGEWMVQTFVVNTVALGHCNNPTGANPMIEERGHDLDAVLDRMLVRVRDAVAGTPAEKVA